MMFMRAAQASFLRRTICGIVMPSIALLLTTVSVSQALAYRFTTFTVDFPSFKESLFGCAATASNDNGVVVGGCNDQAQNSEFRGYLYDGRRFDEVDFKHAKNTTVTDPNVQNAHGLFSRSVYQAARFGNASGTLAHLTRRPVVNAINPQDINNQDHITGWYFENRLRGFIKRNGNVVALDVPNSLFTEPTGINDRDEIVGDYRRQDGSFHGFLYRNGTYTSFDFPSGGDTGAAGINNLGQIVGCYALCSRGFLHNPQTSTFTSIDVPGAVTTQASDINDSGQIVGVYSNDNATLHGFVYDGHSFSILDVPGALITSIFGINNSGRITGSYVVETSPGVFQHHPFIATPQ
jgi:probable HAF family extracellular repeat protein